jgi:hypothetical protein
MKAQRKTVEGLAAVLLLDKVRPADVEPKARTPGQGLADIYIVKVGICPSIAVYRSFVGKALLPGMVVDPQLLAIHGIVRKPALPVVLLGNGELEKALTIRVHRISSGAKQKIEAAGGSVELIA